MIEAFLRQATLSPTKPFLVSDSLRLDYGSAAERVARMADALGGSSCELVGFAENTPRFVLFLVACIRAGRSVYIFSEQDRDEPVYQWLLTRGPAVYDSAALERLMQDAVAVEPLARDSSQQPAPLDALAPVIGFPSSGTTGAKKLLRYRYATLQRRAELLALAYGLDDSDRFLCTSTLAHGHGLMVHFTPALTLGATLGIVRLDTMSVRRLATLHGELRPTVFSALPSLYSLLLRYEAPIELTGAKLVLSGSERLEVELKRAFEERYGTSLVDQFGCAETGPICLMEYHAGERRLGRTLPGKSLTFVPTEAARVFRVVVKSTTMVDQIVHPDGSASSPDELVLNDLVYEDEQGERGMRLLGREEVILYVADRVINLEDIESTLESRFAGTIFLALKSEASAYELLYAGPHGLETSRVLEALAVEPRSLTRVQKIPRNVAGKKLRSRRTLSEVTQVC
jgi:acyl-coenzyme A synthetase/AMP-(fatty) acid ligase